MTDQERLDLIDWHRECIILLGAGVDTLPAQPKGKTKTEEPS